MTLHPGSFQTRIVASLSSGTQEKFKGRLHFSYIEGHGVRGFEELENRTRYPAHALF